MAQKKKQGTASRKGAVERLQNGLLPSIDEQAILKTWKDSQAWFKNIEAELDKVREEREALKAEIKTLKKENNTLKGELKKVRQELGKGAKKPPQRIEGWSIQAPGKKPYYRLYRKIGNKLHWIHIGRTFDTGLARQKIKAYPG